MKKFLLVLATGVSSYGATIPAASGSYSDITNALASSSFGDTITIPAGTNTWTNALSFSGRILQGSGTNNCAIRSLMQITIQATNAGMSELTGIKFLTNSIGYSQFSGLIEIGGSCPRWRIHDCMFLNIGSKNIRVTDSSYGLIDHNIFNGYTCQFITAYATGYGDTSWATADSFGTTNAVYVESNEFYDVRRAGSIDTSQGGRMVVRYNYMQGTFYFAHGLDTSGRYRSVRHIEVYNNSYLYSPSVPFDDKYTFIDLRGGTAVVFSNTVIGVDKMVYIGADRSTDNDPGYAPWYGATGVNGYDSNSVQVLTGTASATSNALYVASASWTNNQWFGYTVYNSNAISGRFVMGLVNTNNDKTMFMCSPRDTRYQFFITNGDPFTVHKAYPQIDQVGMGRGDLMSNDIPVAAWNNETSSPAYFWSNSVYRWQGSVVTPDAITQNVGSGFPHIMLNREFYNSAKPSYTPLVFPHPFIATNPVVVVTNGTRQDNLLGTIGQVSQMR